MKRLQHSLHLAISVVGKAKLWNELLVWSEPDEKVAPDFVERPAENVAYASMVLAGGSPPQDGQGCSRPPCFPKSMMRWNGQPASRR